MHRRTLWTLYAGNLLTAVGVWFFLPLLPIFIGRKGGSAILVGAVFAAGLLANAIVRYPAGWLADRFGTRPVMVVAVLAYALLFLVYLLPLPPAAFIGLRFVHGAAGGAFQPAANGLLADVTPPNERGQAFGTMQATNTLGMIIGPAIGGFIALANLNLVFVCAAAACLLAAGAVATLPNAHIGHDDAEPQRARHIVRRLVPYLILGAGTSYMIGTYDAIWPLYMNYRGGNTFQIGLSFALFGIPATLLSTQAGALGDRFGPRRFVIVALLFTAAFASVYPFVSSIPWLIALGVFEGLFTLAGTPSLNAEVSRSAELGHQGRTQGMFQTVQTVIQIIGALAAGALFSLAPGLAFYAVTVVCAVGAGVALLSRRDRAVGGRPRGAAIDTRPQ